MITSSPSVPASPRPAPLASSGSLVQFEIRGAVASRVETAAAVDPPARARAAIPLPDRPARDDLPTGPRPAFAETFLQRALRTALERRVDELPAATGRGRNAEPAPNGLGAPGSSLLAEAAFAGSLSTFAGATGEALDLRG